MIIDQGGNFNFLFIFQSGKSCFSPGTFAECSSEAEVQHWMRYNIFLLLDVGTFSALVELLNMEIEYALHPLSTTSRCIFCSTFVLSAEAYLTFPFPLSVTVLPVVVLSENQPSPSLTAQISGCCLTSCT